MTLKTSDRHAKDVMPQALKLRIKLEDDIIKQKFKPGDRLNESLLADYFNVSRTPIREAFQYLVGSGLAETLPQKGTFVVKTSLPQLVEMFEVMAELEGMCGRLAARRITDEQVNKLQGSLEDCEKAEQQGCPDAYYYQNEKFHRCIYQASHNNFLIQQVQHLQSRLNPYRRLQLQVRNRVSKSLKEHREIVKAILSGEEKLVETYIKDHIRIQGERFNDFVSSFNH